MTFTRSSSVHTRFVSINASVAYAAESLKLLKAEISRRTERLKTLDRALSGDKRVTREVTARRSLKLRPIACVIYDCQNLFAHERYGGQAGKDAMFITKIGPAFGVMLDQSMQRPDTTSLPTGVSTNVSPRSCLKVMDPRHLGVRERSPASTFRAEVNAAFGYAVGIAAAPTVAHSSYLDMAAKEKAARRAPALRERDAGTLSGVSLSQDDTTSQCGVLSDVSDALGSATSIHWRPFANRPAERLTKRWVGASGDAVRAECAARSVVAVMDGERARSCCATEVDKEISQR